LILKVCALGIIAATSAFLLKDFGWKGVPVFCLLCFTALLSLVGDSAFALVETFNLIGASADVTEGAADILKVIGIGYVAGISSEVCRELGALSIASAVGIFAKLEVILLAAPYLLEAVRLGLELMK
jgi:stage III sporulation protein AD